MNVRFDILADEFISILEHDADRKYVIWGAGECAADFIKRIGRGNSFVSYYVERSEARWGRCNIDNIEIKPIEELFSDSMADAVIIATMYYADVVKELEERGFNGDVYSAFHLAYGEGKYDYRPLAQHLEEVKSMLCDEESRHIVERICEHRKNMDIDYSDIYDSGNYFENGIIKVNPHAVFVDGGAYDGETIEEFIRFQNGEFDKVYSFEMDADHYRTIVAKHWDERVELLNYGLWDVRTSCAYTSDGTASSIGSGELRTECIALDEVIGDGNVTFIKMDIEGAELRALKGAEKCIRRCRPQLAICLYHKPNDIYEITSLIHQWLPEYKLYIRHQSKGMFETILFAVE